MTVNGYEFNKELKKYPFDKDLYYVFCPHCKGRIQVLHEYEEKRTGKLIRENDLTTQTEVMRAHFSKCREGEPYKDSYLHYLE